jgi:hypothetical protein
LPADAARAQPDPVETPRGQRRRGGYAMSKVISSNF